MSLFSKFFCININRGWAHFGHTQRNVAEREQPAVLGDAARFDRGGFASEVLEQPALEYSLNTAIRLQMTGAVRSAHAAAAAG
jgi:hypothetical protein